MNAIRPTETSAARPFQAPMPATWWLKKPSYVLFMMRELSSVFVAAYSVVLLVLLHRLSQGPEAFEAFRSGLKSWFSIALHLVVLAFALLHTFTWFNAAPQSMSVRLGEKKVPPHLIAVLHYCAWIMVSIAVYWLLTRPAAP